MGAELVWALIKLISGKAVKQVQDGVVILTQICTFAYLHPDNYRDYIKNYHDPQKNKNIYPGRP